MKKNPPPPPAAGDDPVSRFRRSMVLDHEKWRDGIGYDLDAIAAAAASSPKLAQQIEAILLSEGVKGWREVEALAALDTPRARKALRAALSGNTEVRMAVARHAPQLVPRRSEVASLVKALETGEFYGGLTQALDRVEQLHPTPVIDALFRGALTREGEVAVHFAAMLLFLNGKAKEPFDWEQRPFCLRFNSADRSERDAVFGELCERIGVDPARYLRPKRGRAHAAPNSPAPSK